MFRLAEIAKLLRYHIDHPNLERHRVMRSVVDSPAWQHMEEVSDPSLVMNYGIYDLGLSWMGLIHSGTTIRSILHGQFSSSYITSCHI